MPQTNHVQKALSHRCTYQKQQVQRLDLALVAMDLGLSRRQIRQAIDCGGVYLNRKRVRLASKPVSEGDQLEIHWRPEFRPSHTAAEPLTTANILWRDPHCIVVNKPVGLICQDGRKGSPANLEKALKPILSQLGIAQKPRLVHRLDQGTSGAIIVALSAQSERFLGQQFRDRKVKKTYHTVTVGQVREQSITARLLPPDRLGIVRCAPEGKPSSTHVRPLGSNQTGLQRVIANPITGRTHQIRVHLASVGAPILGDRKYGKTNSEASINPELLQGLHGHVLHCSKLKFQPHPNSDAISVTAPHPLSLERLWKALETP